MLAVWIVAQPALVQGQVEPPETEASPADAGSTPTAPRRVDVEPVARDTQIASRLQRILTATGWFIEPEVRVEEGVVFLSGQTRSDAHRQWAGRLASSTQDVVAVVNQLEVVHPSAWDLRPALAGVRRLGEEFVGSLPYLAFALLTLLLFFGLARLVAGIARRLTSTSISVSLLREVASRALGLMTFLFGLYIVLKVSGLTRLAVTVLGGTGLFGLVIGIAFRDITENFLASVLLSVQRPFRTGDLVEISGTLGYVQQLNVRTTVLMALNGSLVQIPNAAVYKATIRNFTSNSARREEFTIGIGYDATIAEAQEVALTVLANHPAVLKEPEPWVLADSLGTSTVVLRIYFWLDGSQHSWLKVRSSVIRLIKRAFQEHHISMPDEAREIVFPRGVPLLHVENPNRGNGDAEHVERLRPAVKEESRAVSTTAEGGLSTDAEQLDRQAKQARLPEDGEDLLGPR